MSVLSLKVHSNLILADSCPLVCTAKPLYCCASINYAGAGESRLRISRYTLENLMGTTMTLTDATLVLFLAARIHGTDEAVRASAKICVKKLPRGKRDLMYTVINSRNPLELVGFLAQNLDT